MNLVAIVCNLRFNIRFYKENWKLILHLLLRTKSFGVNNQWRGEHGSIFGLPDKEIKRRIWKLKPLYEEMKRMRWRAVELGFLPREVCRKLGWIKETKQWD